jgi:MFS superfamily sulfate permease-like transporter
MIVRKRGTDIWHPVTGQEDDETIDGLLIIRPEGRIFFINAQETSEKIWELVEQNTPRVVLLDMSRVFDIEYSAMQMIIDHEKSATTDKFTVWFAGFNPDVLAVVRRSGIADQLGDERLYPNIREAIKRFQALQ